MPKIVKKKVVYFSVAIEDYEDEDEVISACYGDLKHGDCGLEFSHISEEDFEEMTQEEMKALFADEDN